MYLTTLQHFLLHRLVHKELSKTRFSENEISLIRDENSRLNEVNRLKKDNSCCLSINHPMNTCAQFTFHIMTEFDLLVLPINLKVNKGHFEQALVSQVLTSL